MERIDSFIAAYFRGWETLKAKFLGDEAPVMGDDVAFSDELERQLIARELRAN